MKGGKITVREASEKLGTTTLYVYYLIRNKKVLAAKTLGTWLVDAASVESYAASHAGLGKRRVEVTRNAGTH